jgi:hypothetical protein
MVKKLMIVVFLVAVGLAAYFLLGRNGGGEERKQLEMATEITSIKEVAEWEFLTVEMEECEDTVIPRMILSDDRFAKIYKGTARLGVNMKEAVADWVTTSHDTARIVLPAIRILDEDIIDDTQTRTFYESGKITPDIREFLYNKAKMDMRRRALSEENVASALANAKAQFTYMFHSLGFNVVLFD